MATGFPTLSNQAYEQSEVMSYLRDLREVEKAPLNERTEARAEWLSALKEHPETVAERVGWLLNGTYGRGSYIKAWEVAKSPRMNRVSAMSQMIAALEWRCPSAFARSAYLKLSKAEQDKVDRLVTHEINEQGSEGVVGFPLLKEV